MDKIASGGMAELYRAKIIGDRGFEKIVAVKKILPYLAFDDVLVSSFIDEAKLAALLQHQNIVQIYDFGTMANSYFIAMELLAGKDLRLSTNKSKQKNMPMDLETALYITAQICDGLEYAHKLRDFQGKPLGIIHRDISPPNILITFSGQVKIIDFGIAKARNQSKDTQVGIIKGKVAYMSPEQADGKVIDHRSDIFATGILLYEMLSRRRMYTGEDTLQVLSRVREARFEPPENVIGYRYPELFRILNRILAKNPDDRYPSSGEMQADIEGLLNKLPNRPSTQGISQYMHRLFEKEISDEDLAMRAAMQVQAPTELPGAGYDTADTLTGFEDAASNITEVIEPDPGPAEEKAAVSTTAEKSNWSERRGVKYAAAVFFVGILVLWSLFVYRKVFLSGDSGGGLSPAGSDKLRAAAVTAFEEKQYSKAAELLQKAVSESPSRKGELLPYYTKALLGQASELAGADPEKAEGLIIRAVELNPGDPEALFQLGLFYTHREQYQKAIAAYSKAAELNPQHPNTFYNLGYIYAKIKNYGKAEEMFERTVKLSPPFMDEALFNLAIVQQRLGKREPFVKNLKLAIEANPNNKLAKEYLDRIDRVKRK
ncbi:MAG: protein kinase [Desulfobacterales bacterium]|nr:protein kinase [Desulfobacterales bacterium]